MLLDNNNIPYRNSCKNCEYERYCNLEPAEKMFKRKCYVDYIAEKMKITPQLLLKRCDKFLWKYGWDCFYGVGCFHYNYWIESSGKERENYASKVLKRWLLKNPHTKSQPDKYCRGEGQLYAAMVNTYYGCWLDEDYIHCARCGKVIKNSKQRNRRFCEDCIGYQKKENDYGICAECGEEFYRETNNQYRCYLCQKEADKAAARERARRYRERKNHGSD